MYAVWNYRKEIEDLNKASEQGWQLVEGGCFHSRFQRNEDVRYRYQIDYTGKVEDPGRYLETFREQGWEFVNKTFNGWHYFRKPYDPNLPEEEYEIFTDRSSLMEMRSRWTKLAGTLTILMGISAAANLLQYILAPKLPTLITLTNMLVMTLFFFRGIVLMKNTERKPTRWDSMVLPLFILVLIAGNVASICLTEQRPYLEASCVTQVQEPMEDGVEWLAFDIAYKDNYYLDLTIQGGNPVTVSILDEAGETVYTVSDSALEADGVPLTLERGSYRVYYFAEDALELTFDLR
jgi:hypothetical protein